MIKINPAIFGEYDIRGKFPQDIDINTAYRLGRAFVKIIKAKKIAATSDRRPESKAIMPAFLAGVKDAGCQIYYLGINSTPTVFFAVKQLKLDGGVSFTASHNPVGYTGLKLCDQNGSLLGLNTGIIKIKNLAETITIKSNQKYKEPQVTNIDINSDYYQFASQIVDLSKIRGFKIVLDASSGSGARLADYFFVRLHSKIIKMNFRPGDKFIDHGPNPLLAKNQKAAIEQVKKSQADLGVIFDGDGDRCIFIDEQGKFISPYYINCLMSKIILNKYKKITIAMDARLRLGLTEVITSAGGKPLISRSGYSNVVKLMQTKKILFGCENSGHYFFNFKIIDRKSNYIFGDAIIPILLILEYLGANKLSLSKATNQFKKSYLVSGEQNYEGVSFPKLEKKLAKKFAKFTIDKLDGISIYDKNWFINLRSSKTEPLVRLNVEARDKKTLDQITNDITSLIN